MGGKLAGTLLATLTDHPDRVTSVAWSSDVHLASASEDRTVRVWWLGEQ